MMRSLGWAVVLSLVVGLSPAWAAIETETVFVSATIPSRSSLALDRDGNSVVRFSAAQLVFDRVDDQDPGVTLPNAGFMYAPYRSETGKNWHLVRINSNASSFTLTARATGPVGGKDLSQVLSLFCGGFFAEGASTPLAGTKSADWEPVEGYREPVIQPFTGIAPFNYRLAISGSGAGVYTGQITFTLTTQ